MQRVLQGYAGVCGFWTYVGQSRRHPSCKRRVEPVPTREIQQGGTQDMLWLHIAVSDEPQVVAERGMECGA